MKKLPNFEGFINESQDISFQINKLIRSEAGSTWARQIDVYVDDRMIEIYNRSAGKMPSRTWEDVIDRLDAEIDELTGGKFVMVGSDKESASWE